MIKFLKYMRNGIDFEKEGFVSIWIGSFSSREGFEDFLEESISDDHEITQPINKFSEDIGIGFYDHDFQEADYYDEPVSIEKLLSQFSYIESFIDDVKNESEKDGLEKNNTAILLYDHDFSELHMSNSKFLTFVGAFPFQTN